MKPVLSIFPGRDWWDKIADEGEAKKAVTIDDVVRELEVPRVDFIKTDIEGAERQALRGAARVSVVLCAPNWLFRRYHYR